MVDIPLSFVSFRGVYTTRPRLAMKSRLNVLRSNEEHLVGKKKKLQIFGQIIKVIFENLPFRFLFGTSLSFKMGSSILESRKEYEGII